MPGHLSSQRVYIGLYIGLAIVALALARLVVAPRPIWLLDEPGAALDDAGKAVLNELIAAHRANGGIVVAAVHEPLGPSPSRTIRVSR